MFIDLSAQRMDTPLPGGTIHSLSESAIWNLESGSRLPPAEGEIRLHTHAPEVSCFYLIEQSIVQIQHAETGWLYTRFFFHAFLVPGIS